MTLETIQEKTSSRLEPKDKPVELDDAEKAAAMELLQAPNLVEECLKDFATCGVRREETNNLVAISRATSRKLGKPLAIVNLSRPSAAGKSSLMDAVLSFMPTRRASRLLRPMTGQKSVSTWAETNLKTKSSRSPKRKASRRQATR